MEPDLLPYFPTTPSAQCVLVLAPHPDDEVFGCGGTLVQMQAAGAHVIEIILTSGDKAGNAEVREAESCAASASLGLPMPVFWGLPDRGILVTPELVDKTAQTVCLHGVDLVLAPSPWEIHPDHRATCQLAIQAVAQSGVGVRLGFYEIGVPLRPNCLCDITAQLALKRQAMDCFVSQMALQDYGEQILALNRFRSYTLGASITHAEAFWFPDAAQWRALTTRLALDWPSAGAVVPKSAAVPAHITFVSVVVCCSGGGAKDEQRLMLQRLLDSISLQTHGNVRVLIIGASAEFSAAWMGCSVKAGNFSDLPSLEPGFVVFARPGDWMLPEHLARMVDAFDRLPMARTVRTTAGFRCSAIQGRADGTDGVPWISVLWRSSDIGVVEQWAKNHPAQTFDEAWLHGLGVSALLDGHSTAWAEAVQLTRKRSWHGKWFRWLKIFTRKKEGAV